MYIVRTKVTKTPFYKDAYFLMHILREKVGYQTLRKSEAKTLLEIFQNYPKIFKDPQKIACDSNCVELTNTIDDERYNTPLAFDLEHILKDLSEEDKKRLLSINGRVLGFGQRFTEVNY